ncbi:MAG: hypothetical protein KBH82_11660, partial [Syntrophorhabdaceae bacterium]|nr:hypothetical protein [Syntrophorhabdaceae bacterium]
QGISQKPAFTYLRSRLYCFFKNPARLRLQGTPFQLTSANGAKAPRPSVTPNGGQAQLNGPKMKESLSRPI